jgi:HSP20 family protein
MTQPATAPAARQETRARLTADVYDTPGGEAYVIEVPVPGLSPDEIVIEVEAGMLTVRTEPSQRNPEAGRRYLQREHIVEPMSRVFEFPMDIDTDNVKASVDKGMLKIRVPKAAAGKRRVIRVGQQG